MPMMKSLGFFVACMLCVQVLPAQTADARLDLEAKVIEAGKQKMLGNMEKASAIYLQVLDKQPGNTLAAYELSRIFLAKGDLTEALKYAGQAAKGDATNIWYQSFYAHVLAETGRFQEAANAITQSLKIFPGEKKLYLDCATYQERAGQITAAIKTYEEMETLFGLQEASISKKATLYVAIGDIKKAAREWEKLCAAYPQRTQFLLRLAEFYLQNGEKEKASATYRKILGIDPREPTALSALAGAGNISTGTVPQDIKTLIGNRDLDAGVKIAKLKTFSEQFEKEKETALGTELLALAKQIETLHPGDYRSLAFSGEILLASGQASEAAIKFRRALDLEENQFTTWEYLLNIYRSLGDAPALLREASNALELFPNKSFLYYCEALALYWQENHSNAKNSLQQALLIGIQDPAARQEALSLQGLVLAAIQNDDLADKAFAEAKATFRETAVLQARLAINLATRSPQAEASLQAARRAIELAPNNREALYALARSFYARSQFKDAQQTLEPILTANANPQILELWGDLLFKQGAGAEALAYWEQAKANGNKSPRLMKKISDKKLYE